MAMNILFARNIQARNEIAKLSNVATRLISYQTKGPNIGSIQDNNVGMAELTKEGIQFDKWHAMALMATADQFTKPLNFVQNTIYSGRDLVSLVLHSINITGRKPSVYMAQYAPFIKYNPKDINIQIENGYLKSGIIDKACIGGSTKNSIYHIINNQLGSAKALDQIYVFSQLVAQFLYNHGFTVGIRDLILSKKAIDQVKTNTEMMVYASRRITEKLNKRELHPPIGISVAEFYESEQLKALNPGDEFVVPILADIDFNTNKLVKMVFTGSKGNPTNIIQINAALGSQTINGKRPLKSVGYMRTSPYYTRYDLEPKANGYVSTSFMEGIQPDVFAFVAAEARHSTISNSLSTSITGYQNRLSVKNLESMITDNLRKAVKGQNMIQPLYAESGIDPRKFERVKYHTVLISTDDMEKQFHSKPEDFEDSEVSKQALKSMLDAEFNSLVRDREWYRQIYITIENHNPGNVLIDDSQFSPINIQKIIDDIIFGYKHILNEIPARERKLDPSMVIKKSDEICKMLPYLYFNEIQEKAKRDIPEYIDAATSLLNVLIRSYVCTAYLKKKGFITQFLDILSDKIRYTFKKSLVDYGSAVGIIAAQCISEPMTQYVLDSKHRTSGGGGTKTNAIIRCKEIFGVQTTAKMKNPSMLIMPRPEHLKNKAKVQEIANHIEMMSFSRFIHSSMIFFEEFGKIVHPQFIHENQMIKDFLKHNYGMHVPSDLTKWCIRYELDKEDLIIYSMKLDTIINALKIKFPAIFFVYTPENASKIIIRCYIRNTMLKTALYTTEENIIEIMRSMQKIIIRGTKGITSAKLIEIAKSQINIDGSISSDKVYAIDTAGTNLEEMLENQYINAYQTQSDSITEFAEIFGIDAARNKIIVELIKTMNNLSKDHCMVFADEMTYSGRVTSIQKTGLQTREMSNITLRLSFQSPVQVVENAAIDSMVDRISGVSGPLICGQTPNIGTTYNKIIVNKQFMQEFKRQAENIEDVL